MNCALVFFSTAVTAAGLAVQGPPGSDARAAVGGCRGGCDATTGWLAAAFAADLEDRPKSSDWSKKFEMMVEAGHAEPCHPDIMVTSYGRHVGFGSRMGGLVDELILGMFRAGSFPGGLSLCNGNDHGYTDWQKLFQNIANFSNCYSTGRYCRNGDSYDSYRLGAQLAIALKIKDRAYLDGLMRFLYRKVLTYTKETQEKVDELLQGVGLDKHEPYVAVHIRRGDKWIEAKPTPTSAYADSILNNTQRRTSMLKKVRSEIEASGIKQVFLASDNASVLTDLQAELGDRVRIVMQQPDGVEIRAYQANNGTYALLANIEAFKYAQVFVGTGSSSLGRLVYYLRDPNSKSISLDTDFDAKL